VGEPDGDRYYAVPVTQNRRIVELGFGAICGLLALVYAFAPADEGYPRWLLVPVFSLLSLDLLARGIDERPRLTIDADGILDRTSIAQGHLRILWADILSVEASRFPGFLHLKVRDAKALRARAGLRRRLGMWIGTLFGNSSVSISTTLLAVSRVQLKERLEVELLRFERAQLGFSEDQGELPPGGASDQT